MWEDPTRHDKPIASVTFETIADLLKQYVWPCKISEGATSRRINGIILSVV